MNGEVSRLLMAFYGTPWAILPDRLAAMRAVLQRWETGGRLSPAEIQAAIGDAPQAATERQARSGASPRSVAVIPIYGVIAPRIHMVENISGAGGIAAERISRNLRAALDNPDVGAIVLDVDSPGGSVYGIGELADEIHAARGQKKIVAVANHLAASAAFWIGTAAEELVVTPGGEVGSVGVFGAHEDHSAALERKGVKVTLISAGKYKTEGNAYQPLSEEAQGTLQANVDRYYDLFTRGLARNRGVTAAGVRKDFGEGRTVSADEAVKRGMADRIGTLDETIARLSRSAQAQRPRHRDAAALRLAELS